jgi:hypothetical protein
LRQSAPPAGFKAAARSAIGPVGGSSSAMPWLFYHGQAGAELRKAGALPGEVAELV